MRSDVNKILTETYKEGGGRKGHGRSQFARGKIAQHFDEVGGKFSMHLYNNERSFGENLAYLPRFLNKQVGRKWDDIYSEISKTFDRRSTVNDHIFQHLFDYFTPAKNLEWKDGEWWVLRNYGTSAPLSKEASLGCRLYVDPNDGILKKNKAWKSYSFNRRKQNRDHKAVLAQTKKVIAPGVEMHKLDDGFWYVFTIKKIPEPKVIYAFPEKDAFVRQMTDQELREWIAARKAFKLLSQAEKELKGIRTVVQFTPPDFYRRIREENRSTSTYRGFYNRYGQKASPTTHYYASCRTASKRELRAAGL